MKPFAIRIAVTTPVALSHLLHLDGLLGYALTARGGSLEDLPLRRTDGVWHASAAMLETGMFGAAQVAVQKIKALKDDSAPEGLFNGIKKAERTVGAMSTKYRSVLGEFMTWAGVRALWFTGNGDVDSVRDLLSDIRGIGGRMSVGYGRVGHISKEEIGNNNEAGLVIKDGIAARTIPVDVWTSWGKSLHPRAEIRNARPKPPYWTGEATRCVEPHQTDILGTRSDILGWISA